MVAISMGVMRVPSVSWPSLDSRWAIRRYARGAVRAVARRGAGSGRSARRRVPPSDVVRDDLRGARARVVQQAAGHVRRELVPLDDEVVGGGSEDRHPVGLANTATHAALNGEVAVRDEDDPRFGTCDMLRVLEYLEVSEVDLD